MKFWWGQISKDPLTSHGYFMFMKANLQESIYIARLFHAIVRPDVSRVVSMEQFLITIRSLVLQQVRKTWVS